MAVSISGDSASSQGRDDGRLQQVRYMHVAHLQSSQALTGLWYSWATSRRWYENGRCYSLQTW